MAQIETNVVNTSFIHFDNQSDATVRFHIERSGEYVDKVIATVVIVIASILFV